MGAGLIGAACTENAQCNDGSCIGDLPGGYCSKHCAADAGCPGGSVCFATGMEEVCLKTCTAADGCRMAEGYTCDRDMTCWPTGP